MPENCTPTITDRDFTVATIASPRGGMSDSDEEELTSTDETDDKGQEEEENKENE